jgi:putative PEP-CTERM system TPR-repeat lipoprotein
LTLSLIGCGDSTDDSPQAFIARAKEYQQKGDLRATVIELKNALQRDPDNSEARWLLGNVYLEIGSGPAAQKELTRAVELGIAPEEAMVPLTRAALLQRNFEQVVQEVIHEVISGDRTGALPDDIRSELLALRGHAFRETAKPKKAASLYDEALTIQPTNSEARIGQVHQRLAMGEKEQAASDLAALVRDAPDFAAGWALTGDIALNNGDLQAADAAYSKAIALKFSAVDERLKRALVRLALGEHEGAAEDIVAVKRQVKRHALLSYAEGVLAAAQGDAEQARRHLEEAEQAAPDYEPAVYRLGVLYLGEGAYEKANTKLSRFLREHPDSPRIARLLGAVRLKLKDYAGAERAIAQAPPDAATLEMLSEAARGQGKPEAGLGYLREAATRSPESPQVRVKLGQGLMAEGRSDQAAEEFEKALKLDPEFQQAEVLLIMTYLKDGKIDQAIAAAEELSRKRPESVVPKNLLGMAYFEKGDLAKARSYFERVLATVKGQPVASHYLARLALTDGNADEALKLYEEVLKEHPNHRSTLLLLGGLEANLGERRSAASRFEQVMRNDPTDLAPRLLLSRLYRGSGESQQALSVIEPVKDRYPSNPALLTELGLVQLEVGQPAKALTTFETLLKVTPDSADAHFLAARAYEGMNDSEGLARALNAMLASDPDHLRANLAMVRLDMQQGRMEAAEQRLTKLRATYPDHPEPLAREGDLALRRGDAEGAVTAYGAAVEKAPVRVWVLNLARAQRLAGDSAAAGETLESWLQSRPGDAQAKLALASVYLDLGREGDAEALYGQVLDSDANNVVALNNLATLLRERDSKQALQYAERAYELSPESPAVLDTLGTVLLELGESGRSVTLLERASKKSGGHPTIQFHLAKALAHSGEKARARGLLNELIAGGEVFDELPEARALLSSLTE